ncbi:MAG: Rrf2 family transcriptional regulator [Nitrospirota bacterium]|jgi:Rrf2 family protein
MMQITRQADYAIRCVYYLSGKPGGVTMIEEIAREMSIPQSFLAKILQKLAKAGIVKSQRGARGGFGLAREPRQISLYDVLVAVEGPIAVNVCAIDKKLCDVSSQCKIHPVWVGVRKEMEKTLKGENFEKLRK